MCPSTCKVISLKEKCLKLNGFDIVSVESVIVHASDYDPRRELTGKQFFVIAVRDSVGLVYVSLDWVLG